RAVEHDLEREQDDQRVAPQEHAERAGREQERGDGQVPHHVRAEHQCCTSPGRRAWWPRMTPPTAATSSPIEVISKASRWSVRNRRPIWAGLPKLRPMCSEWASRPLALSPMTTITSTRIAAAASTAPTT